MTPEGIETRRILRAQRADWSEVVGFNLRRANAADAVYIGVELRDGKRMETGGLTAASGRSKYAAWTLREMEQYRRSVLLPDPD